MANLVVSVLPGVDETKRQTEWEGEGREFYDQDIDNASSLLAALGEGLRKAAEALTGYGSALRLAQVHIENGRASEKELAQVVARGKSGEFPPVDTSSVSASGAMREWDDIRESTGFFDWLSDLGVDVESVRAEAERLFVEADAGYGTAKRTEEASREDCMKAIRDVLASLPDYVADSAENSAIISSTPGLPGEMAEAVALNANTRLPGVGLVPGYSEGKVVGDVSPALQEMRDLAVGLPGGTTPAWSSMEGVFNSDEVRHQWISDNRQVIEAAARQYGVSPTLLAGIAQQEVGGKSMDYDDYIYDGRRNLPEWARVGPLSSGEDATSFGPMSLQVRRAAETLGYDPAALSEQQRTEVINSLKNPKESVFIAAKHLSELKQEAGYGLVEPSSMTPEAEREIAARYNGGPAWQGGDAQNYADKYTAELGKAEEAMGY